MLQRTQSLYLALAALCLVAFLALNYVWAYGALARIAWIPTALLVLGSLTVVVTVGAVFLYKQRARQRQIVITAQWLVLLVLLLLAVGVWQTGAAFVAGPLLVVPFLPIPAYGFLFLARRGVEKDIKLVRSMDRLRD